MLLTIKILKKLISVLFLADGNSSHVHNDTTNYNQPTAFKYYRPSFSCTDIDEEECAIIASQHDDHNYCFENLFAREKCCVCHGGKQDFVDAGKFAHFFYRLL